jgi:L-ascorbate metabolism protein UlaG (beta-lactamase superfamily)
MKRMTRRLLLGGAATAAGVGGLEYLSLTGRFDHRAPVAASAARATFAAGIAALAAPEIASGALVHVGHSTHLLSVGGARMLTDPWFHDPAFGAMAHLGGPAVPPEEIGPLDAILVSHDHPDHIDARAADRLDKRAVAVVATSELAARMRGLGFASAVVLAPWQAIELGGARVSAVPGVHDVYEVGFIIEGAGHRVYFAGDTRLFDELPAIAERFAPTFAILPVDGTRITGGDLHVMTPEDAVEAARTLGVRAAMPSHAEAVFSDPLVAHALATTIAGAPARFAGAMARALPAVSCLVPAAGDLVALPT